MILADLCVRRPVFATMVIGSWSCWACSPHRLSPSICFPRSTSWS